MDSHAMFLKNNDIGIMFMVSSVICMVPNYADMPLGLK